MEELISWRDFEKIEIRTATVLEAELLVGANKPAIKLTLDFGSFGIMQSSAQITKFYTPEVLIGRQVVAVVNFPPKQIGKFKSECLVLGAIGAEGEVTLLMPDFSVENGSRIA